MPPRKTPLKAHQPLNSAPSLRRSELQRKTPLQPSGGLGSRPEPLRRAAMPKVSAKRAKEERAYGKLRAEWLPAHWFCERVTCPNLSTDVHHMRGRVGADLLDTRMWLALCRDCHRWVTEHPREAIEAGLSLPRIGRGAA